MMRWLKGLTLCVLLLSLSGCVWLRLLQTQRQIADFDQNFRIESNDQFSLRFLQPTLLADDFTTLSGIEATDSQAGANGGQYRRYVFQKIDANGQVVHNPRGEVAFQLEFNGEARLQRWTFSPIFLAIAPAAFLETSLRSLGNAAVDQGHRRLNADLDQLPKVNAPLPLRSAVVAALGEPNETKPHSIGTLYIYRLRLNGRAVSPEYEKNREALIKLYFDAQTDRLAKMTSKFVGLKISVNYARLAQSLGE